MLKEIGPYMDRVRFYPHTRASPVRLGMQVSLETVGHVTRECQKRLMKMQQLDIWRYAVVIAQIQATEILQPLKTEITTLILRTCDEGLWPFQKRPGCEQDSECPGCAQEKGCWREWLTRAKVVLEAVDVFEKTSAASLNSRKLTKGSLKDMLAIVHKIVTKSGESEDGMDRAVKQLTPCEVGRIRSILKGTEKKRGLPGTELYQKRMTQMQQTVANAASYRKAYEEVYELLKSEDQADGVSADRLNQIISSVQAEIPQGLYNMIQRATRGSISELIEKGIITSAASLAALAPAITAHMASAGAADPELYRLMVLLRKAFSKRRSVLLTGLQSQVRLEELPWVPPLLKQCDNTSDSRKTAENTLRRLAIDCLQHFPWTIIPNTLLKCFRDLAAAAQLENVVFTDLICADFFQSQFSNKFPRAARIACRYMQGSVYATYYGVNCSQSIDDPQTLMRLCVTRAGFGDHDRFWSCTSKNGCIIEQMEILTTHNLAGLYEALKLGEDLNGLELSRRIWRWMLKTMESSTGLCSLKNLAYAWRQLIFFLSTCQHKTLQEAFVVELKTILSQTIDDDRSRRKILDGFIAPLENALHGIPPPRPLYGWVSGDTHPITRVFLD